MIFTLSLKNIFAFLGLIFWVCTSAQTDSISVFAQLSEDKKTLLVQQKIRYYNNSESPLDTIKLLNWTAAYRSKNTPLAKRKLEDRNSDLYFAKSLDYGSLKHLDLNINNISVRFLESDQENLWIPLDAPLSPNNFVDLSLNYTLILPNQKFTGYGTSQNSVLLKYFFIVPDRFQPSKERHFLDTEERVSYSTFWSVKLDIPPHYYSSSNLKKIGKNNFESFSAIDPEILISSRELPEISAQIDGQTVLVSFGYELNPYEKSRLEVDLIKLLTFLKNKWGFLPEKIFISEKFKNKEDFFGNNDIRFWKFNFPLFAPGENLEMDYASILSKKYVDEALAVHKEENHWISNGLKSYLEHQYLKKYYSDAKLFGSLPDSFSLLGIKPLKWFHASKLKLMERYGLAYQYMVSQNLDQAIATPFSELSNFNEMAISQFETGSVFNFVADKMKVENFDRLLKTYIEQHQNQIINQDDLLLELAKNSNGASDFFAPFIKNKQRVNFKINNFKRKNGDLLVDVSKNTALSVPFRLETQSSVKNGIRKQYWFDTPTRKSREIYVVPDSSAVKLTLNSEYFFPESNFRDNYLYTKGLFSNAKKFKFKLIKDIPNPEYNEIYLNPKLNFNIYDKVLLGLNFSNASFFSQPFLYSFTPYFSTGTGRVTGSGGISYSILPANSFFNALSFGVSGSYFHYTPTLSYGKFSAGASMLFSKNPRSSISRTAFASFTHFQKDLDLLMKLNNEYESYNIWSLGYGFSDRKMIHEKSLGLSLQGMEDYTKATAEAFYRWEFAKNKKVSFRLFAGMFLNNKTRNNFFDFGISRVSNYSFSYGLYGQGETDGFWSQQFVLADGGFKSIIPHTADKCLASLNIDAHAWKMFNLYADFGAFNSQGLGTQFIWDSGVKLKVIPDFLEIYFPIQSSLGFEPGFQDYAKRIRFSLVLSLNSIIGSARRGWF